MRNFKMLLGIGLVVSMLVTGCGSGAAGPNDMSGVVDDSEMIEGVFEFDHKNASMEYDPDVWEVIDYQNDKVLQLSAENGYAIIAVEKVVTDVDEETFVENVKDFLLDNGVADGDIREGVLSGYPLLNFTLLQDRITFYNKAMVVKTDDGYYEVVFNYGTDEFIDYEEEVIKVLESFTLISTSDQDKDVKTE